MRSLVDGFLGVELDVRTSPILGVTSVSLMVICLICQCGVAIIGIRSMIRKGSVQTKFKCLFALSCVCSCSATVFGIEFIVKLMRSNVRPVLMIITGGNLSLTMYYFMSILLTILVLRLHVTFSDTQHRMSNATYLMFITMLALLFVLPLVNTTLFLTVSDYRDQFRSTSYPEWYLTTGAVIMFLFYFLFIIGSIMAMILFVSNLDKLAKAQADTPRTSEAGVSLPSLNRRQQRFIDLAARYMLLFSIAMMTTTFSSILSAAFSVTSGIHFAILTVDFTVNVFCVYLQFGFAGEHYRKYCGCFDKCCRKR